MDPTCLDHQLEPAEAEAFGKNGYFVVKNALAPQQIAPLIQAVDRLDAEYRPKLDIAPDHALNLLDFIGKDDLFLELLDCPRTFAKVWGLLGWHIQLYHSHMIVTPPLPSDAPPKRLGWHQDSGRLNIDIETQPRPRISLKVAYFLTDCTDPASGAFHAVPGSQKDNKLEFPADGVSDPPTAVPVPVRAGDAVFFDRRIWHAPGHNHSANSRKALFYGYSYRWLRPRDDMSVEHYMERSDPIRRQLLGASPSGGYGYTSPSPEDVPLKGWIASHLGADAVVR
jgi:ectoine hydroxylase